MLSLQEWQDTVPYEWEAKDPPPRPQAGITPPYGPELPSTVVTGPVRVHGTDRTHKRGGYDGPSPAVVEWSELDLEVGGETGEVDRNAYVLNGFGVPDIHNFRGDRTPVPRRVTVNEGAVGTGDDAATAYVQGLAAQSYPNITPEMSWDAISQGY